MVILLDLLLIFGIGALLGWVMEVIFRFFVSQKKLVNPGFLNGPYLPLYGFGAVILFLLSSLEVSWPILVFLFAASLTLLELITGIIFIYHLRIKLWDYKDEWFNYRGLICLRFTLYWTLIGIGFFIFVFPVLSDATTFFSRHLSLFFVIGIYYGLLGADMFNSFSLAYKIRASVKEFNEGQVQKFWVDYRQFKERIRTGLKETSTTNVFERYFLSFNNLSHNELSLKVREGFEDKMRKLNENLYEGGERIKKLNRDINISGERIKERIREFDRGFP